MEASPVVAVSAAPDRELVMSHVWDNVVNDFESGEYVRARKSYAFFEALESMTDSEFIDACTCDDEGCCCHQ